MSKLKLVSKKVNENISLTEIARRKRGMRPMLNGYRFPRIESGYFRRRF